VNATLAKTQIPETTVNVNVTLAKTQIPKTNANASLVYLASPSVMRDVKEKSERKSDGKKWQQLR
jgi:hypothetical protein